MKNNDLEKALKNAKVHVNAAKNCFFEINRQSNIDKALRELEKALELIKNDN
jgi:ribosomal protein S21